ncbi:MAG: glycosyltransferase [Flavobacteriales bacterium]
MFTGKRILVAPLDWGLGHSTRCIPIIQALLKRGAVPVIGADNGPLALLRTEFPALEHVRLPGATIRYSKSGSQLWSMVRQFPEMVRSVRAENALFDRIRRDLQLDAAISDQRFGLRARELPSVLITHQVFPFTPIAQGLLRRTNLRHIARFDRCWIMDEPEAPGLAGELSHGRDLPANARYIGTVSRMQAGGARGEGRFRIVAVISGPEPHRTLLEGILMDQLQRIEGHHLLVRGLPGKAARAEHGNVTSVPHLASAELAAALASAGLVVSRSGYTTLMDLVALCRSALVIPTPGQAEQEYLGRLHARTGRFRVQPQHQVDIRSALRDASAGALLKPSADHRGLEQALDELGKLFR